MNEGNRETADREERLDDEVPPDTAPPGSLASFKRAGREGLPEVKPGWTLGASGQTVPDPPGAKPSTPGLRRRDTWLWLWPVLALAAMALLSERLGPFGLLLSTVGSIGGITLLIGAAYFKNKVTLAVALGTVVLGFLVVLARIEHLIDDRPAARPSPSASPRPSAGSAATSDRGTVDRIRRGDAQGAALGAVTLDGEDLTASRLRGVQAAAASFVNATLDRSQLVGADLRGADLRHARLRHANLRGANLAGADLRYAVMTDACLAGADLTGALLDEAVLTGTVIDGAKTTPSAVNLATGWSTPGPDGEAACRLGT